jgi:hypothetical protein
MIPIAAGSRLLEYIKGFNQSSADAKAINQEKVSDKLLLDGVRLNIPLCRRSDYHFGM